MSNVFSAVQCRVCSVIVSESEVSVVVPEIAELAIVGGCVEVLRAERRMV